MGMEDQSGEKMGPVGILLVPVMLLGMMALLGVGIGLMFRAMQWAYGG